MSNDRNIPQPSGRELPGRRRLGNSLPLLALVLLVVTTAVLFFWIIGKGEAIQEQKAKGLKTDQPPVNVVALELKPGPIRERISLPGVVRPWVALTVVAEVRGKIVEKAVSEGETVAEGTVLARIDSRDYRNAHASARASHQAALAAYNRIVALHESGVATRNQLDDATAQMETTRAAMENAALSLERCEIVSPMAGVVDRLPVEHGQFLSVGDPVADILQMDRVKVEVDIPESDVDAVRRIRDFEVTIDALKDKAFAGTSHYLSRSAGNLARSYRLEVAVPNPDGEILPDMFARVDIVKHEVPDGLAVPLYALVPFQDKQAVYVAEAGQARRVTVRTGIQEGWQVEVAEGLAAGDRVIVVGQREVSDGKPIQVLRTVASVEELKP